MSLNIICSIGNIGLNETVETLICYTAVSMEPSGCRVSCTGLYADVWNKDEQAFELGSSTGKKESM